MGRAHAIQFETLQICKIELLPVVLALAFTPIIYNDHWVISANNPQYFRNITNGQCYFGENFTQHNKTIAALPTSLVNSLSLSGLIMKIEDVVVIGIPSDF